MDKSIVCGFLAHPVDLHVSTDSATVYAACCVDIFSFKNVGLDVTLLAKIVSNVLTC